MGSIRMRFTPAERKAFTTGTAVEYLDVTRWYPATVATGIKEYSDGQQYIEVIRNHKLTRSMLSGNPRVDPKHLRLPEGQRTGKYV